MRLLVRHRNRASEEFISKVQQLLPHRDHESLIAHTSWHLAHEQRNTQRRQLLERWRGLKAATSAAPRSASEAPASRPGAEDAAEERRRQAQAKAKEQQEIEVRKNEVAEWRKARTDSLRAQQEGIQRAQRESEERERQERQRQRDVARETLEAHRQQRAEQEAREKEAFAVAGGSQRPLSAEGRSRIAERNKQLLQRRESHLQELEARQRAAARNFEPPTRGSCSTLARYMHVGSKLESHTEIYVERARDLLSEEEIARASNSSKYGVVAGNFAHQGIVRTTRMCPSWRPNFGV